MADYYTIHEDDLDQCPHPEWDSDGEVTLYWNHPDYPNQWSGHHKYWGDKEEYGQIAPARRASLGPWSAYHIILNRFGLRDKEGKISKDDLFKMSPKELKEIE